MIDSLHLSTTPNIKFSQIYNLLSDKYATVNKLLGSIGFLHKQCNSTVQYNSFKDATILLSDGNEQKVDNLLVTKLS